MSATKQPWIRDGRMLMFNDGQEKPMSLLGLDTDGVAIVWEEDDAKLMAAAPDLFAALEFFLDTAPEPPPKNCACHINPPCNDCVEHSGMREAIRDAKAAIAKAKGPK